MVESQRGHRHRAWWSSTQEHRNDTDGPTCLRAVDPGGERLRHLSREDCSETAPLPGPGEGPTPRRVSSREDWSISTTPCLPDPPSTRVAKEGAGVLGVGIDWAEEYHDIALGTVAKGVTDQFRIEHSPAGVERLIERCLALEPDPAEVRVVLETRHGLLVEALLDAGFSVVPVNPDPGRSSSWSGAQERRCRRRSDLLPAGVGPPRWAARAHSPWGVGWGAARDRPRR